MPDYVNHNPDILTCLANLSNDEVFTPPELANQVLDLIPEDLWKDPNVKVLDPACKSGVFLRECAKRFLTGLEPVIPDLQERIDHIFQKQLFGYAITELTAYMSRRSVYCSKSADGKYSVTHFERDWGNIVYKHVAHTWNGGKCVFCGVSKEVYDKGKEYESYAYRFIHLSDKKFEELKSMKFDLIISNPPYQLNDGGGSNGISAKPIYHLFVNQAKKLMPRYITMIIPSRWFAGGKGLDDFRYEMLHDKRIRKIVNYPKSRDCFQGVDIAGGINYFLWNRDNAGDCEFVTKVGDMENLKIRQLDKYSILISDNIGVEIIEKVRALKEKTVSELVFPRNSFGFTTSYRGSDAPFEGALTLYSSAGKSYIKREDVTKNPEFMDYYKISIGTLNPDRAGVNNASDGKMSVTTKVRILKPGELPTETYIVIAVFKEEKEAIQFAKYIKTKFARYLVSLTLSSMHIVKDNFQFVPIPEFSNEEITDDLLYKKYGLSTKEIDWIESHIRDMDGGFDE